MSIEIINERQRSTEKITELNFYKDGELCAGFDLDKDMNPVFHCKEAEKNYNSLMSNPDYTSEYFTYNHSYTENAKGKCHCGEIIELYDEYMGACECPKCGRWYNLFGQELNPPTTWSDGEDW